MGVPALQPASLMGPNLTYLAELGARAGFFPLFPHECAETRTRRLQMSHPGHPRATF